MPKIAYQILLLSMIIVTMMLSEKFGVRREVLGAFGVIAFSGIAISLYRLRSRGDLSDTLVGIIFIARGRREALIWGWVIWFFALSAFAVSLLIYG